ncbi:MULTISPECIES: hypothetical protein [Rhodopseudomonas]|uniref:Uncharacterized protein n=1 Tax=Rhodopseudomonas palustris TaxID=1076 RepID=A0A0D7F6S8_RHOPL|nr:MULTISPECIES: hypothetical protein [Rhodopseudomonas]KIZ47422.1 hypothetical protein OO17_04435 [Rhodopseudomonas palustris]MDF3810990.1 hypothetical protein [Rhodopseudomonas sp. BAL398]WOK15891.1 hypothetical protein RBJ75_17130 [Rhodopseudomonas sp. BAL398]
MIDFRARKLTWQEAGRVTEPGRYLYKFGWLTITPDDIAVWQTHPNAAFALVAYPPSDAIDAIDEYHLGSFELRQP